MAGDYGNWFQIRSGDTHSSLRNGEERSYRIAAVNSAGRGEFAEASTTPSSDFALTAVQNLTATVDNQEITLSWDEPLSAEFSAIDYYQYQHRILGSGDYSEFVSIGTSLTVTIDGLENGTTYEFFVRGVTFDHGATPGSEVSAVPAGQPPGPVQNLEFDFVSGTGTLTWEAPADDGGSAISRYEWRYREEDETTWGSWTSVGTSLTATDSSLDEEVSYVFEVRAVNVVGDGESAQTSWTSTIVSVTIDTASQAVEGGTEVSLDATADGDELVFDWFADPAAGEFPDGVSSEDVIWVAPFADEDSQFVLTLRVRNSSNVTATASITITVRAGTPLTITMPERDDDRVFGSSWIAIIPQITNADNSISYSWGQEGDVIVNNPIDSSTFARMPEPTAAAQNVSLTLTAVDDVTGETAIASIFFMVVPRISPMESVFNLSVADTDGMAWSEFSQPIQYSGTNMNVGLIDTFAFEARGIGEIKSDYVDDTPAFVTSLALVDDGRMILYLNDSNSISYGTTAGPELTDDAEMNLGLATINPNGIIRKWELSDLISSDDTEPYRFSAASVSTAGPTNNESLRDEFVNFWSIGIALVDMSNSNIDWSDLTVTGTVDDDDVVDPDSVPDPTTDDGEPFALSGGVSVQIVTPEISMGGEAELRVRAVADDPDGIARFQFDWSATAGVVSGGDQNIVIFTAPAATASDQDVTITVDLVDVRTSRTASATLEIVVVGEPGRPPAPTVSASIVSSRLNVSYQKATTGGTPDNWDIRWREDGTTVWSTIYYITEDEYSISELDDQTAYEVRVRARNASGVSRWSLITDQDTSTYQDLYQFGSYKLEADWDRDGNYGHARSDLFTYLLKKEITTKRGRDYGSQVFGRTVAGNLTFDLRNEDNEFDRLNTNSSLYDMDIIETPVRLSIEDIDNLGEYRVLWTGSIDKVRYTQRNSGQDEVSFTCRDVVVELVSTDVSAPLGRDITTADAMRTLLDIADIDEDRWGDISGDIVMEFWWTRLTSLVRSIREIEETEGGFFYIDEFNRPSLESSSSRSTGRSRVSQLTLDDSIHDIISLRPEDPLKDVTNRVKIPVRQFSVGDVAELWRLSSPIALDSGESTSFVIEYPDSSSGSELAVETWIDMEPGLDYAANDVSGVGFNVEDDGDRTSDLIVRAVDGGNIRTIYVENTSSTLLNLNVLNARGKVLREQQRLYVEVVSETSISKYGDREYDGQSQFLTTIDQAHTYGSHVIALYSDPQYKYKVRFQTNSDLSLTYLLKLSDRVTLTRKGESEDQFIENISHVIGPDLRHDMVLTLTSTLFQDDVMRLGVGPALGVATLGR